MIAAGERLAREIGALDCWHRRAQEQGWLRPGAIATAERFVTQRDWQSDPWTEALFRPHDLRHLLGLVGESKLPHQHRLQYSFFRGGKSKAFFEPKEQRLRRLRPHLLRAGRLLFQFRALDQAKALAEGAVQRLALPVLLLDEKSRVKLASARGERLLAQGIFFRIGADGAVCARLANGGGWDRALALALQGESSDCLVRGAGGEVLLCQAAPGPSQWGAPSVLLVLRDVSRSDGRLAQQLRRLFQLTRAEAEVALAAFEGATVPEIAAERQVLPSSVKSQLASIYAKLGVSRRADFVRLLSRL